MAEQETVRPRSHWSIFESALTIETLSAAALRKNRSEFMLDAARQAAHDALLDRTLFRLDADRYGAFVAVLDAAPAPTEELKCLLGTPAPWER